MSKGRTEGFARTTVYRNCVHPSKIVPGEVTSPFRDPSAAQPTSKLPEIPTPLLFNLLYCHVLNKKGRSHKALAQILNKLRAKVVFPAGVFVNIDDIKWTADNLENILKNLSEKHSW